MTKTLNFSTNGIDFGNYSADSKETAQEVFAQDAGYASWYAMVEQAEEFGGNTVEVRETSEAAWSVQGSNAASHAAANVYLSKTPAWNIGESTLADILAQRDEALDALRELLTDMVIAQGNMRDAAKRDARWEGCAEAIQPRVDAARATIAKYTGEAA